MTGACVFKKKNIKQENKSQQRSCTRVCVWINEKNLMTKRNKANVPGTRPLQELTASFFFHTLM
jgi:hypothetical protein